MHHRILSLLRRVLRIDTSALALVAALTAVGAPSTASAGLVGDSIKAKLTSNFNDPFCGPPFFIPFCPSATVNGVTVVAGQEAGLAPILVDGAYNYSINVNSNGFAVSVFNSDNVNHGLSPFELELSDLDWVGMPSVVIDGVFADAGNPSASAISFTDHGTTVEIRGPLGLAALSTTTWNFTFSTHDTLQVPEPASMALVAAALLALAAVRRRRSGLPK